MIGTPGIDLGAGARFRQGFSTQEGMSFPYIFRAKVVDINLVAWTVDVHSQYEEMFFGDVPVGSPYLHYTRGEGFTAIPEIGSYCFVCVPSDTSPPFVLSFVMPRVESVLDGNTEGVDVAAVNKGYSYGGGRLDPKPGDIYLRGRDGNFVILHRGGVLQVGSTELAQRVYIPLENFVMDFAEKYNLHAAGGSIAWAIQEGPVETQPTQWSQTFRVFANSKYADIRVVAGKVHVPVGEHSNGFQTDITDLEIGTKDSAPVIYEVAISKEGFNAESGVVKDASTVESTVLRYFFDREGNCFMRSEGNVMIGIQKKLRLKVKGGIEIVEGNLNLSVETDMKVTAGGTVELTGAVLKLNGGESPVAKVGDLVTCMITAPVPITVGPPPGTPGTILAGASFTGTITGPGNSTVLV